MKSTGKKPSRRFRSVRGYTNTMGRPSCSKVTVNIGMGEGGARHVKLLDTAVAELGQIAGQKPVITRAKKSIANFKIRKGNAIGCMVTLRASACTNFSTAFPPSCLPRVRDFKGLPPNSFDGRGNYTIGIKDQLVFPEIDYTRVDKIKGMNVTITTTHETTRKARAAEAAWRSFPGVRRATKHGAYQSVREDEEEAEVKIRNRNRCRICGRPRGFLRKLKCAASVFRGHALREKFPAW